MKCRWGGTRCANSLMLLFWAHETAAMWPLMPSNACGNTRASFVDPPLPACLASSAHARPCNSVPQHFAGLPWLPGASGHLLKCFLHLRGPSVQLPVLTHASRHLKVSLLGLFFTSPGRPEFFLLGSLDQNSFHVV